MADISGNTFDELKRYVSVRLQQGVPILDSDWNEMDDIRRHELKNFLKLFVGDGVTKSNAGFRIIPLTTGINFAVQKGLCLVSGWEAFNPTDINYTDQELFKNPGLATAWGVAPLTKLEDLALGTYAVYLDVWEREVEDASNSVYAITGINPCVRVKLEWVVRVAASMPTTVPEGHAYYLLAYINVAGSPKTIQLLSDQRKRVLADFENHEINAGRYSGQAVIASFQGGALESDNVIRNRLVLENPYYDHNANETRVSETSLDFRLNSTKGFESGTHLYHRKNVFGIWRSNFDDATKTTKSLNALSIDNNGNVGVGTMDQKEILQIGDKISFHNGGWKGLTFNGYHDPIDGWKYSTDGGLGTLLWDTQQNAFRFWIAAPGKKDEKASTTERLTILNNGNVGIGTAGPDGRLTMIGNKLEHGSISFQTEDADIAFDGGNDQRFLVLQKNNCSLEFMGGNIGIGKKPQTSLDVAGKIKCANERKHVSATGWISIEGVHDYTDMQDMSLQINTAENPVFIIFKASDVRPKDRDIWAYFRLLVDDREVAVSHHHINFSPYETKEVTLTWLGILSAGVHNIKVQWREENSLVVVLGNYGVTRHLIAIEL